MKLKVILAAAVVVSMATSAQAISLVVMTTNTTAIAGDKVYDIGVKVTSADVAAGGANPVLFVQNITFPGVVNGPIQAASANNKQDIQTVWGTLDTLSANAIGNGGAGGPSFPTSGAGTVQLYKDSWWYSGGTGSLQGINGSTSDGSADTVGTVTTVPNQGLVYAQGPGALVGTTGYLFQPEATGITGGAASNATMGYTGLFGPLGANFWDPSSGGPFTDPNHILGDLLVANGGTLTVPLAQLIVKGNFSIPSTPGGAGTFLEMGNPIYNVLGGNQNVDPGAVLYYSGPNANQIVGSPEPGTMVLAALGAVGLALAWRRRK